MVKDKKEVVSTIKHHKRNNFVIVDRAIVNDHRLSWKAKGIMMYLLAQADGWQFYESEIVTHSKNKEDSLSTGLKELEQYGYLVRTWLRDEKGRFNGREWDVYEIPLEGSMSDRENTGSGFSGTGITSTGITGTGKPAANNNNSNKINNNKNNNTPGGGEKPLSGCCCEEVNQMSTSGSKLSQEEIKDIMRIYNVEVFKPEVMSVLSGYSEAEIHQIGSVLQKKQTDGKIQNPTALLIKNPAQICVAIMADQFYPTQQRKWSSEVEIYISPQELEELKRNCQPL